jgi:hypothetical protein
MMVTYERSRSSLMPVSNYVEDNLRDEDSTVGLQCTRPRQNAVELRLTHYI